MLRLSVTLFLGILKYKVEIMYQAITGNIFG
jgi:hypothetical protein